MTRTALRPALNFSRELDRFFNGHVPRDRNWTPSVDTHETKEAFMVTMELPGVASDDVRIRLEDGTLTVTGEKKAIFDESKSGKYVHFERAFGQFTRSFNVPKTVNAEGIEASYKDGVLTITLPKSEVAQPKEIQVKTG